MRTAPFSRPEPSPVVRAGAALALRALVSLATLVGAALLVQLLVATAPGDAIDLLPNGEDLRASLAAAWGLDRPVSERLLLTAGRILRGDLGESLTYRPGVPVAELVVTGGARSLALLLPASLISVGLALGAGVASRPWLRKGMTLVGALPAFLAAHLLVATLNGAAWAAMERGWIQRPEWFALPDQAGAVRTALIITVLVVASGGLAEVVAAAEAEIGAIRTAPWLEATRARGEPTAPHWIRHLWAPALRLASERVAWMVGGLVVAEKVCLYNGAGAMLWQAARLRDWPLCVGLVLAAAALVCAARFAADAARVVIDPRTW
jgi:peptide/nickel transport system permease protein